MNKKQSGNVVVIVLIVVVILALIGAGFYVWSRNDKKEETNTTQESSTEVVPRTIEKTKDTTEVITNVDVLLQIPGDETKLPPETPDSFVEYIKTKLIDFDCDYTENENAGITVSRVSPRFASGGVGCMGGAGTVWYLTTVGWEELGYQSMIPCSTLVELAIPSEFMAECYDDNSPDQETIANPNGKLNID